ncbi:MAG: ATP-binding protein [Omnitrophica bacterium]|nr:ATP-binding protein [Candidatus Omnitrophota bacterium]
MALYTLSRNSEYKVSALLTTLTTDYGRISMHGVREVLLEQQAAAIGLNLKKVFISKETSNQEYESKIRKALEEYKLNEAFDVGFGDIFLEDLRKYREEQLAKVGLKGVFPIWKQDTFDLAHKFIDLGFKAIITCVDSKVMDGKFAGRDFDKSFLSELPSDVDPCGENGEFHSFVYEGPIFKKKIPHRKGEIVLRDKRFYYCDLLPLRDDVTRPQ